MSISPELRAFLADWLAWVERGAPDLQPYPRYCGLCASLWVYLDGDDDSDAQIELMETFASDGLGGDYPFGAQEYDDAANNEAMHKDENRLAWVRAKLAESDPDCCDAGKVWNNADPTSGMWLPCEVHGGDL